MLRRGHPPGLRRVHGIIERGSALPVDVFAVPGERDPVLPQQLGRGEVVRAGARVREAIGHHLLGSDRGDLVEKRRFAELGQAGGGGPFAIEEGDADSCRVSRRRNRSVLLQRSPNLCTDVPQRGG